MYELQSLEMHSDTRCHVVCVLSVIVLLCTVALTRMSDMFLGLFSHMMGVLRLLNILLVSGSICAYFVIVSAFFSSRCIPVILGVRVVLNTSGMVCVVLCRLFMFCCCLLRACCISACLSIERK